MAKLNLAQVMRAHISGGHAKLIRFAEVAEQADGLLGDYDNLINTEYAWPNLPDGALIDNAYTKVWIKDALLQYFQTSIGQGENVTKLAGYNNRVRAANTVFQETEAFDRDAVLLDRDVAVNDIVKVRGVNGDGDSVTLWSYVKSLIADEVATDVADATADANNAATQGASAATAYVSGPLNCVTAVADGTDYAGAATGDLTETYDILVTEASVDGDFTTATLRVISGSGGDDVTAVAPAAAGAETTIGTRGLVVTFDLVDTEACSASATADDVPPNDLAVGQRWQVTVSQAFTAPVPTSGGTYTGDDDATYIITVTRGGTYAGALKPQIQVTTTGGTDVSGPTNVTAAATAAVAGSLGVTIAFSGTMLNKGDRYYIVVVGTSDGPVKVIELGHNLDSDIAASSELDLTLYIRKEALQIPQNREGSAPDTNWDVTATDITVNSAITAFDATWTDDGVEQALTVLSEATIGFGQVFVETRAWLDDHCTVVGTIDDIADIDAAISGALDPDNPLKWGVAKALENANGQEVKFTSVCDPNSVASWTSVLDLLEGRNNVYNLVPLTRNLTVLNAFATHVKTMSEVEQGLWRRVWINLRGVPEIPLVAASSVIPNHLEATTSDGEVALGVIEDDPQTTGTQYTVLRCTTVNALFVTTGVRAGDIVRLLYTSDGFGNATYSEYVVDSVTSQNELMLVAGPADPISVAAKFEVWRNLTAAEEAAELAANATSWGDRRVSAVWPDQISSGGTLMEGYFLCCSLAGLASGIQPHQGMTNLAILGYDDVSRTTFKFNRVQLNAMAAAGVHIVTQDLNAAVGVVGKVTSRQAVTTGLFTDINQREEVVTRNVDTVLYRLQDAVEPFRGITNVSAMQGRIGSEAFNLMEVLKQEGTGQELGAQIISGQVISVQPSLLFADQIVLTLNLVIPYPFNRMTVQLTVGGLALTSSSTATTGAA